MDIIFLCHLPQVLSHKPKWFPCGNSFLKRLLNVYKYSVTCQIPAGASSSRKVFDISHLSHISSLIAMEIVSFIHIPLGPRICWVFFSQWLMTRVLCLPYSSPEKRDWNDPLFSFYVTANSFKGWALWRGCAFPALVKAPSRAPLPAGEKLPSHCEAFHAPALSRLIQRIESRYIMGNKTPFPYSEICLMEIVSATSTLYFIINGFLTKF